MGGHQHAPIYPHTLAAGDASPVQQCLKAADRLTSVCVGKTHPKNHPLAAEVYVQAVDAFHQSTFDLVLIDARVR